MNPTDHNQKTEFQKGQEILRQQSILGFSGQLEMSIGKIFGYIHAMGQWNNFYPAKICPLLKEMDDSAPTMQYGPDNPNTGKNITNG